MHTYCTRGNSCVGSNFGIGIWSVSTYHMSMYASANSCVDRPNTESGRDPASRLTQRGANKRREQVMPAETNEYKQQRLRKRRRDRSRHSTQTTNGRNKNCQSECLAAEITADKDTRWQQMSALQHKPKG